MMITHETHEIAAALAKMQGKTTEQMVARVLEEYPGISDAQMHCAFSLAADEARAESRRHHAEADALERYRERKLSGTLQDNRRK